MQKVWKGTARLMLVPMLLLCAWLVTGTARAADSTYVLELSTGAATGDEKDIEFFIITYDTAKSTGHSKFIFPSEDAWTETYEMAEAASTAQTQRDAAVRTNYGYSGINLKVGKRAYQAYSTDQYLFTAPEPITQITRIQIFTSASDGSGSWDCRGIRIFQVDELGGLYRWNTASSDCYIDFRGKLIAEGATNMGRNIDWTNDKLFSAEVGGTIIPLKNTGFDADYADHPLQDNTQKTLALRLEFADTYGAGLETLTAMSDANGSTLSSMGVAETMAVTLYYNDRYGTKRAAKVPGVLNAVDWTASLLGADASEPLGGFAQQGESVMLGVFLPDYGSLIQSEGVTVTLGSEAASLLGVTALSGMPSAAAAAQRTQRLKVCKTDEAALTAFEVFDLTDTTLHEQQEKLRQEAEAKRQQAQAETRKQAEEAVRKAAETANAKVEEARKKAEEERRRKAEESASQISEEMRAKARAEMNYTFYDGKSFVLEPKSATGKVAGIKGNSHSEYTELALRTADNSPYTVWTFQKVGEDGIYGSYYQIINPVSGNADLNINRGIGTVYNPASGAKVTTRQVTNPQSQSVWFIDRTDDGYYVITLRAGESRYCLDARNEERLEVHTKDDSDTQKWVLYEVIGNTTGEVNTSGNLLDVKDLSGKSFLLEPQHAAGMCAAASSDVYNVELQKQRVNPRMMWVFTYMGMDRDSGLAFYTITNLETGKLIDVGVNEFDLLPSEKVFQNSFSSRKTKFWYVENAGDGCCLITNRVNRDMCLQIVDGSKDAGTYIRIRNKSGLDSQKWKLVDMKDVPIETTDPYALSGKTFYLAPKHAPGMCVDVKNSSDANGANVQLGEQGANSHLLWLFTYAGTDDVGGKATPYYTITNLGSGKVFDLPGRNNAKSGQSVSQYDFEAQYDDQLWYLEEAGSGYTGYYVISNRNNSGICLDAWGKGTSSGTDVRVSDKNNGDNQKWQLIEADYGAILIKNADSSQDLQVGGESSMFTASVDKSCGAIRYDTALEPTLYRPTTSSSGMFLYAGKNVVSLTAYESGSRRTPRDSTERYLVELTTDKVYGSGTKDDIYMSIGWKDLGGSIKASDALNVRTLARDFNGWWYATKADGSLYADDVAYYRGVATGQTLRFFVPLQDVKAITDIQVWMGADGNQDDWQMIDLSISLVNSYGKRAAVWEAFDVDGVTGAMQFTRELSVTPVYRYSDTTSNPVLLQQGADESTNVGPSRKGDSAEVETTKFVDWSQMRYSMTFQQASQDLGFAKERYLYAVTVNVASNENASAADGDCGSKNLFYFRLIFKSGSSSFVLANQQLPADGFVAGAAQTFYISTNQDYGDVTAVQIIPEDISENSDKFDKLNIASIEVKKTTTGAIAPKWTIGTVGWIGIDYRDDGQLQSVMGQAGRSASEMIRSYTVDGSTFDVNFMLSIQTEGYAAGKPQFEGNLSAVVYYDPYLPSSGYEQIGDVTKSLYSYINHTAQMSDLIGGKTISDPSLMFRAGHTDRFYFSVSNAQSIRRIEFQVTSAVDTIWYISNISLSMVNGNGSLIINSQGEYERVYDPGEELELLGESDSKNIPAYEVLLTPYITRENERPTVLNVNFTEIQKIQINPESMQWTSVVSREPESENDTLSAFFYPQADAEIDPNDLPVAAIQYTTTDGRHEQISTTDTMSKALYNGQPVYYATNLSASRFSMLESVGIYGNRQGTGNIVGAVRAVVRQIRSGVVIRTWELSGSGYTDPAGIVFGTNIPTTTRQQHVQLQLGTDVPRTALSAKTSSLSEEENSSVQRDDLAVALWYRSDDPVGMELRSPYIYLSDMDYTEIRPGQVLDLTFRQQNIAEITGVALVSMGEVRGTVAAARVEDREIGVESGTVTETYGTYSFGSPATLSSAPNRMAQSGLVKPLTLTIKTGEPVEKEGGGTGAPVRVTLGYYNQYDNAETRVIDDVRAYLIDSEARFTTGSTKTAQLLVSNVAQLRWIKLEPWHDTGTGAASWTLASVGAALGDEANTDRAVNAVVREGTPLTVMLTDISLKLTAATTKGSEQTVKETVGGTIDILTSSGGTVTIAPVLTGSDEGWTAVAERVVDGFPESASTTIQTENVTIPTTEEDAATESALVNRTVKGIIFTAPENTSGATTQYRVTISSKESPDVSAVVNIGVESASEETTGD